MRHCVIDSPTKAHLTEADLNLAIYYFKKMYGNMRGFDSAWFRLQSEIQNKCGKKGWSAYKGNIAEMLKIMKDNDPEFYDQWLKNWTKELNLRG